MFSNAPAAQIEATTFLFKNSSCNQTPRHDRWIANIKRDIVKNSDIKYPHVCSIHFHEGESLETAIMIYILNCCI